MSQTERRPSVTIAALHQAVQWLDAYDGEGVDDQEIAATKAEMSSVAEWLRAEVSKREEDAQVREIVRRTGGKATAKRAREILRAQRSS